MKLWLAVFPMESVTVSTPDAAPVQERLVPRSVLTLQVALGVTE